MKISANIAEGRFGRRLAGSEIKRLLAEEVARILDPVAKPLPLFAKKPQVVLVVGVNGSGKTTTIGKLASQLRGAGKSVMIAAGDTFRAAAVEQLSVWGERAGVPVLFGIIADFHDDYHTPRDTVDKINRVDAVHAINLWDEIASSMATRPDRFAFNDGSQEEEPEPQASRAESKVRFGIMPGNYDEDTIGVLVGQVTPGGSADEAGVESGDLLMRWNGVKIGNVMEWMGMLASHEPGETVRVGIKRGGEELTLDVTLQAK